MKSARNIPLCAMAALLLAAASAANAGASPIWKFEGSRLNGSETIAGSVSAGSFTVPGLTTTCDVSYEMAIFNTAAEVGKGDLFELSFSNCSVSNEACTVNPITADSLSWPLHLVTIGSNDYVVIENVHISIFYNGELCPVGETLITVTGKAGGLFASSTIEFSPSTFSATGTELKALGQKITWNAVLSTEAQGLHAGHALEVG